MRPSDQILTLAEMRAAEQALIDAGTSVDALMQIAGRGAADWVWRLAGRNRVTVLCGPGNNGGDGYVIAETIRERGGDVAVVAGSEPASDACRNARSLFGGTVLDADAAPHGEVLVDCLFGSGLTRPLSDSHFRLLDRLARSHRLTVAIDLPSGVHTDSGMELNAALPENDLTIALGAWKPAHVLMPAAAKIGALRLVPIGVSECGSIHLLGKPSLAAPAADAHKYRRGLLTVVGGAMPGAALLACTAAQGAGAGYVKLLSDRAEGVPMDLVHEPAQLPEALSDERIAAVLIGPGLGRNSGARERLGAALAVKAPLVLDADALLLLGAAGLAGRAPGETIATPHEGELAALERTFGLDGSGSKIDRARALAVASGMIVVAKGPDTVIAEPTGRIDCAPRASSWLSTAGTGDVLAGVIASRLACERDPIAAARAGVWLHAEAARLSGPAFTAGELARNVPAALAACQ